MNHYPEYRAGRLDSQAQAALDEIVSRGSPSMATLTPAEARASLVPSSWQGGAVPLAAVRDVAIAGPAGPLPARVYVPEGRAPLPVLVFFHGGGFVTGALPDCDGFLGRVAQGAGCLVVSVGYRLGPEHRWPAAPDDACAALAWVAEHAAALGGDRSRLAVAGNSAGANLATLAAIASRDAGGPRLALQVLLSPWVDLSSTAAESFRLFGGGPWLSADTVRWFRGHYLADASQARDPRVSPLLAEDLAGLPPAVIVNAEFDVLRDQAAAYATRLQAAGNAVEYRLHPGTLHDFAMLPGLFDRAADAIADITSALRRSFARSARTVPTASAVYDDGTIEALAREQYRKGDAEFRIRPDRAALLLIDMQEEFATDVGGPYRVPEAGRRLPAMARLLQDARRRGLPVVHTAFAGSHHLLDRPRLGDRMPNRAGETGFDDSLLFRSPRFVPALAPLDSEVVIHKPSYGAFYDTPLETILKRLQVDTVILAGTLTDCCVGTTARQAYERGFGAVVASDATATLLPEMHQAELAILRRSFARVLTVDAIVAELDAATAPAAGTAA